MLDTENLAMSLQMQTWAQPSGTLHSGGRGDQIITRIIIACGKPRGAPASLVLEGEERQRPLLGEESLILGFTVKPHLSGDRAVNTITGPECQPGTVRVPKTGAELSRRSSCPPAPPPKGVVPSLVLTP